jgi:cyclopropane fatty-acyl-phospholipid synthase-like methyltransferase
MTRTLEELMTQAAFPRSQAYDNAWMLEHNMGPNAVWLTEALCEHMTLRPGMRVLDLGCGKALSSVFLAREFGVQVWATDLWIKATENRERIEAAGMEDRIFPIHAEARSLPYAERFFDAVVSLDAYHYFGTDDLYFGAHMARLIKPGGQFGIVVPGLMQELPDPVPEHLLPMWDPKECFSFHTNDWWRQHIAQSGCARVTHCDTIEDGWRHWADFERAKQLADAFRFDEELPVVEADGGRYLGFIRLVAEVTDDAHG